MKRALITGITGQDGSYLAENLLEKGYRVIGMVRRSSTTSLERIAHIQHDIDLVTGDLLDESSLVAAIRQAEPDELYNLAAQSVVHTSFAQPVFTGEVNGLGVTRLLAAIRNTDPGIRFYQASTSEIFGNVRESPQSEHTALHPRSPYGVAKVYAHWITINARESHGLHASSGILFNHESPRRGIEFVTRKITSTAARIKRGLAETLELGDLDAHRDWGFAGDFVEAMWLMLQLDEPDDFVIATGHAHSIREFCERAFDYVGLNYLDFVTTSDAHVRPAEVDLLVGDPAKARRVLGWEPKVGFDDLVALMMQSDLDLVDREIRFGS